MAHWTCPQCSRVFGAAGRSHVCKPGTTIDELADRSIASFRPIVDRIEEHLRGLPHADDELIVDPLDKLVQFKRGSVFVIVRPMTKWTAVGFTLRRRLDSGRLSRKVSEQGGTYHHVVNVDDVEQVDDELLDWLTEAYGPTASSELDDAAAPSPGDPMVPDDVDIW